MSAQPATSIKSVLPLHTSAHEFSISYFDRPGDGATILFVHGLGNAAANFLDLLHEPPLARHRLVALDLPGCGDTPYVGQLNIDDLVTVVESFVNALDLPPFVLIGASMGGLVALLYAERNSTRVRSFVNLEGNLAPEDCMFSRLVTPHDYMRFESEIFPAIKKSLGSRPGIGFAKHLQVLELADPHAYYDYSFQTVEYSDHGHLLERFVSLPMPLHFVYGEANRHLSYLPALRKSQCNIVEIANADHFMFYDNPAAVAGAIASSLEGCTS